MFNFDLKAFLDNNNISPSEVGKLMQEQSGVSEKTIYNYTREKHSRIPSLDMLGKIILALEVILDKPIKIDDILQFESAPSISINTIIELSLPKEKYPSYHKAIKELMAEHERADIEAYRKMEVGYSLAISYYYIGDLENSLYFYHIVQKSAEKNTLLYIGALAGLGDIRYRKGELIEAQKQYREARALLRRGLNSINESGNQNQDEVLSWEKGIARITAYIAETERSLGMLSHARHTFLNAKTQAEKLGDIDTVVFSLNGLGFIEATSYEFKKAEKLHDQAFKKAKHTNNHSGQAIALSGTVNLCRKKMIISTMKLEPIDIDLDSFKKIDMVADMIEKAINIAYQIGDNRAYLYAKLTKARLLLTQKFIKFRGLDFDYVSFHGAEEDCVKILAEVQNGFLKVGDKRGLAYTKLTQATIYDTLMESELKKVSYLKEAANYCFITDTLSWVLSNSQVEVPEKPDLDFLEKAMGRLGLDKMENLRVAFGAAFRLEKKKGIVGGDSRAFLLAFYNLGRTYRNTGENNYAEMYLKIARVYRMKRLPETSDHTDIIADIYRVLADVLINRGAYKTEDGKLTILNLYYAAVSYYSQIGNDKGRASAYNGIGFVKQLCGGLELDDSVWNHELAYKIFDKTGDLRGKAYTNFYLASYYCKTNNFSDGKIRLDEAIKLFENVRDIRGSAYALQLYLQYYELTKDKDKIYEYFLEAMRRFEQIGDERGIAYNYLYYILLFSRYPNTAFFHRIKDNDFRGKAEEYFKKIGDRAGLEMLDKEHKVFEEPDNNKKTRFALI